MSETLDESAEHNTGGRKPRVSFLSPWQYRQPSRDRDIDLATRASETLPPSRRRRPEAAREL
jgi:hypothetical protein